jgi:surfactin synthase thioesterase subunit
VVLAADDPGIPGYRSGYHGWRLVTRQVDLRALADGGHYFVASRPAQVAAILTAAMRE